MNYLYENNLVNNVSEKFNTHTSYKKSIFEEQELKLNKILELV